MTIVLIILFAFFLFMLLKHTFKALVIILLSFIALYITNPPEERFESYYSNQISKEEVDKNWLETLTLEGFKMQGRLTLKRKNLYVFSIYQVDRLDKKIGYLGFFNIFIPIYEEDDLAI